MKSTTQANIKLDVMGSDEGFIEIASLDELDRLVGGYLSPDAIFLDSLDKSNYAAPSLKGEF